MVMEEKDIRARLEIIEAVQQLKMDNKERPSTYLDGQIYILKVVLEEKT